MRTPSLFRLPILWLFLGPPIVRLGDRVAMDSLQGSFDFWNFFQAGWWMLGGAVAFRELYLNRAHLRGFLKGAGSLPLWSSLWLFALFLSSVVSSAPLLSFAKATLMGALVLAAADLGVKFYAGLVPVRRVLKILLISAVGLLLLVGVVFFLTPSLVTGHYEASASFLSLRTRGGRIAYTPFLSIVALVLGLYFFLTTRGLGRWLNVLVMGVGFFFLALGQTRSAYGGFAAALLLFAWRWAQLDKNMVRLMAGTALVVATVCIAGLTYDWSSSVAQRYDTTFQYVIRDAESLSTLTGRTQVIDALWEEVARRPLGLGYSAGPRAFLLSESFVASVHTDAFGNAHNAYLEILAGAGYLGFIAWMALVFGVGNTARTMRERDLIPIATLLVAALLEGVTESTLALPLYHTSVLFWIAAAVAAAYRARRVRHPASFMQPA